MVDSYSYQQHISWNRAYINIPCGGCFAALFDLGKQMQIITLLLQCSARSNYLPDRHMPVIVYFSPRLNGTCKISAHTKSYCNMYFAGNGSHTHWPTHTRHILCDIQPQFLIKKLIPHCSITFVLTVIIIQSTDGSLVSVNESNGAVDQSNKGR